MGLVRFLIFPLELFFLYGNFRCSSPFDLLLLTEKSVFGFCRSVGQEDVFLASKLTGEIHEQEKHQSDCED